MIVLIYVVLPLYAYIKTVISFKYLADKTMLDSFGAFYRGMNLKHGRKVLLNPLMFHLKRLGLIFLVYFGPEYFIL